MVGKWGQNDSLKYDSVERMAVPVIDDDEAIYTHDVPQHQVVVHGGMDQVPGQHLRPLHQRQHFPILWAEQM